MVSEIDLRSTKRKVIAASKLFDNEYDLTAPTDLKEYGIIDLQSQANRRLDSRLIMVREHEFDLKKTLYKNVVAVATDDMVKRIRYSVDATDTALTIAELNTTTADGGTWIAVGDATSVATDTFNYITGGGSVSFTLGGASTTAGISNVGITTFDITNYKSDGSVFAWVYINSTTNLTNFILRIGNDITANYYTQTVTTTNEGVAFIAGWNLLRFDFVSMSQTGTVTATACDSVSLYMTKSSGKSDGTYRVDNIVLHSGEYYNLLFYSRYPWQDTNGTFIIDSTADTDYINADTDEMRLFELRGKAELNRENNQWDQYKANMGDYIQAKNDYERKNPSERARADNLYHRIQL